MTSEARKAAVVVGGGISGLVVAKRLADAGVAVTLLEAEGRLGGKIRTDELDGGYVEAGPDAFLARDSRPFELCRSLGLTDALTNPAIFAGLVLLRGTLRPLPREIVYGVPASPAALCTPLLAPRGALRAAGDLVLPGPLRGPDVSVAELVKRRFGRDVLRNLVDPLLAGTRAGDVQEMSLAAATPELDAAARSHRSVLLGLRAARSAGVVAAAFTSVRGGLEKLVEALARDLASADVRRRATVTSVARQHSGDYVVVATDERIRADAVAIATPAGEAARILERSAPAAARELAKIDYASSAIVSLLYRRGEVPEERLSGASGFLVPSSEQRTITGASWFARKWPHATSQHEVVRCFVGRAGRHPALDLDDDDLAMRIAGELTEIVGAPRAPLTHSVARWDAALPEYRVGHLDLVRRAENALAPFPGIALTGAGYRGSGIPACITQGSSAAERLLKHLQGADKAPGSAASDSVT